MRLGLTQWSHNAWQRKFYPKGCPSGDRLARYAEVFNTVEGNTTFYASPSPETVQRWHQATPDHFRFTFKFPRQITHDFQLSNCRDVVSEFIHLLKPLHEKTALWKIQLPSTFGPESLGSLAQFIRALPEHCHAGVEVRHPAFFAKGEAERALNRLLIETQSDRIIMDSRPVFSAEPNTAAVIDAQQKKPKVPVHAIATSNSPMVRFIGHPDIEANDAFFEPWLAKIPAWLAEGKTPYLMIHTPDNDLAPELAERLYKKVSDKLGLPKLGDLRPADNSPQFSLL
ncbi:DUF72 domain-containing protein [Parasalinivibrio latis]|uniref:DUF72 domain-containing protein n=1 Tax=Parasalinivibrio latis TaxID=2952610 RepID=UPI0030E3D12E